MQRMTFAANTPKIGRAPNGLAGLRLRKSWKNYVRNSNAYDAWTPTGTSVATANTTASPDGATNADTLTDDDGAAYEAMSATSDAVPSDSETYRLAVYAQKTVGQTHAAGINWSVTGGTPVARSPRLNTNDGTCVPASGYPNATPIGTGWWLWGDSVVNNGTNTVVAFQLFPASTTLPLPGADTGAGTGAKVFYEAQVSRGKLWREPQPTPAGTGATCADCAATYPAARIVRGGRLSVRFCWTPTGAPTDYNEDCRLVDHGSETTHVTLSTSDQKIRVVVAGGATETCAVPVWWPSASLLSTAHPVLEFCIEVGGGVATRIRYRYSTDGGVTWSLPFDPLGGAAGVAQGNVSSSGNIGILTGATAGNVADGWLHEYDSILTAPAWTLQALPTDVASVKAHLRADGHYVISTTTISSWTSQTATAISVAQGTAANQPALVAAGINTRPAMDFDGSNDFMAWTGLSFAAADILVVAALRPLARISPDATLFDSTTGRILCVTDSVNTTPAGSVGWYDGAYKSAGVSLTMSATQIVSWDLRAASNGRIFVNGVQVGSTTTYTQKAVGGTTNLGADIGGINPYVGRVGDFIIATAPTDTLRRNLESFLSTKYGIAVS
jgi:hypothetical protein